MVIPLITFFASLLILLFMVSYQSWRMRAGVVVAKEVSVPDLLHEQAIKHMKTNMRRSLQKGVHFAIMWTLKGWVVLTHSVSKKFKQYFPKTVAFFKASPKTPKEGATGSFFLHSVAEYKQKVKKFKQKIREVDDKKKTNV